MCWERVYTVENYYDCPRSGFADVDGKPHAYNCRFDNIVDDWTDEYFITEVDTDLLALVIEKWAIWKCWEKAFHKGEIAFATFPVLSEDRPRYLTLKKAIEERLAIPNTKGHLVKGRFRRTEQKPEFGLGNFEVEWTQIGK